MKEKLILVLLDGLSYNVAHEHMGYMMALSENEKAYKYKMKSELPSLSRPLYETILTGVTPIESGIVNNNIVRLSNEESIFSLCKESNLKTAAAAYYWISELYNAAPFDYIKDRDTENENSDIQYGRFYFEDDYPDTHLFLDGEYLRRKFDPDFLLIHTMNIDDMGHKFGLNSREYRNSARKADHILSNFIPSWVDKGYHIIVTSDHGMHDDKVHGGISDEERLVPLWLIGEKFKKINSNDNLSQLILAPNFCDILGVRKSDKMLQNYIKLTGEKNE